jgi:hypothetical protein
MATMDTRYGQIRVPRAYKRAHKFIKVKAKEIADKLDNFVKRAGAWRRARWCLGIQTTYSKYMKQLIKEYKETSYDFALEDYEYALSIEARKPVLERKKERLDSLRKQVDVVVAKYISLYDCLLNKQIEWEEARHILKSGYTGAKQSEKPRSNSKLIADETIFDLKF